MVTGDKVYGPIGGRDCWQALSAISVSNTGRQDSGSGRLQGKGFAVRRMEYDVTQLHRGIASREEDTTNLRSEQTTSGAA